jgi:hypothetical protein
LPFVASRPRDSRLIIPIRKPAASAGILALRRDKSPSMSLTMSGASVPIFNQYLTALSRLLDKRRLTRRGARLIRTRFSSPGFFRTCIRWHAKCSSRATLPRALWRVSPAVAPGVASEDASTEARSPADATRGATRTADNGAGPRAQDLGKNVSGIFAYAPASNTAYPPSFVMRGFPSSLTLFDGAAHGVTAQVADLSRIDIVEFCKRPSAMLLNISP